MPAILVVDDSTTDRRVVGILLKRDGDWQIDYAIHGGEALEKMQQAPFDLVLSDLLMPGMNGLELVAAVRRSYPHVPVILMTSRGNEGIAVLALREGAASYIPKALLPRKLGETIRRVMAVSVRRRDHGQFPDFVLGNPRSFTFGNDVAAIERLVSCLQENVMRVGLCDEAQGRQIGVALQEALLNALFHGNLEAGARLSTEHLEASPSLVAELGRDSPYCDRRIHASVTLTPDEATFVIRHEGKGFDPSTLPDPRDASALEKATGRGVILMRLFMDKVMFDKSGCEVTMIKLRKSGRSPTEQGDA